MKDESKIAEPVTVDESFVQSPGDWLAAKAAQHDLKYLLVHAVDGVTWGRLEEKGFLLSHTVFPHDLDEIQLRSETLQQARLFGPEGELYLWQTGDDGFAARLIADGEKTSHDCLEEGYWLWGNKLIESRGFILMNEGQQGLRHAPPHEGDLKENQRLQLIVRHFIEPDTDDRAVISLSRLMDIKIVEGGA
jgi:CRISPR-associated protein (TIGR03984 family)